MFDRLVNTERISLVTDGMYKICFDNACIITVGVLVKDSVWRRHGHTSSYVELMYGLFKSESSESFKSLKQSLYRSVQQLMGLNLEGKICQLHGDYCEGLEKMRKENMRCTTRTFPA